MSPTSGASHFHHPLTPSGWSDLVGPGPRQRDALLRLFFTSQREAQLPSPRNSARCVPVHLFRRHPARQQDRIYRLSGLLHHPHDHVLRPSHRAAPLHRPKECPERTVLDGFSGLCRQRYRRTTDCIFQHHVLLP